MNDQSAADADAVEDALADLFGLDVPTHDVTTPEVSLDVEGFCLACGDVPFLDNCQTRAVLAIAAGARDVRLTISQYGTVPHRHRQTVYSLDITPAVAEHAKAVVSSLRSLYRVLGIDRDQLLPPGR